MRLEPATEVAGSNPPAWLKTPAERHALVPVGGSTVR